MRKPLIGVSLCRWKLKDRDEGWFHLVGEKYVKAITAYDAIPLAVPALADELDIAAFLDYVSGMVFSGSVSNVHPSFYGDPHEGCGLADKVRDVTVLRVMAAAIERGIPTLGICRGIQEMNVLYGGTLHRQVQEVSGRLDHREVPNVPDHICYAPVHNISLREGGVLQQIHGVREFAVNSLHGQGIDRLGAGLQIEAQTPDGQIEAVSVINAKAFAVGVQWHPEYRPRENPNYDKFMQAFHQAVRTYQQTQERV